MTPSEPNGAAVSATDLVEAAADAIPDDAVIAVAGELPQTGAKGKVFVPFEPESLDSAGAIVELERSRTKGTGFLALPARADMWLDELALFGDHCRSRYDVIFESAHLGVVLDLRRRAAADSERSEEAHEGAPREGTTTVEPEGDVDALETLAAALARFARDGGYSSEEFRRFERHGVHVTPVHSSPIPNTSQLSDEVWSRESELIGIDMNDNEQIRLLREVFPEFRDEYEALPTVATGDPTTFHFDNGLFGGTDALVLYCMLRHLQPRRVVEVGSGYSTRLAAQAALANGSTELTCIDPYPDEVIQTGFPGLTSLLTSRVEDVPLDLFTSLEARDVLFIDSSHVVRIGGDVSFLILEVLPRLQPGVVVQMHDVFLPREYPRGWVVDMLRFWNEQYLLQAFLAFNDVFRVVLANSYLDARYPDVLRSTFPTAPWWGGGSFWFQRRRDSPMQSEESLDRFAELGDCLHTAPAVAEKVGLSMGIRHRLQDVEGAMAGAKPASVPSLLSDVSLEEWGELLLGIPAEYPNLRARFPSMPTSEDQTRWTGAHGTGLLAQSVGFVRWLVDECDPRPDSKVLDFGCGWGRLMRLLYKYVSADNLYGVDPWSESLRVCREHGVIGHLALSEWLPRTLPFVGPFDLIYAFSVFTHLSEETTAASLETLRRYIAHHGALVITVRPPEIWEDIQQPNMIAEHHRRGFAFSPLNNSATYGDSSITTEYLTEKFPFWRVEKQLLHGEPLQHYLLLRAC